MNNKPTLTNRALGLHSPITWIKILEILRDNLINSNKDMGPYYLCINIFRIKELQGYLRKDRDESLIRDLFDNLKYISPVKEDIIEYWSSEFDESNNLLEVSALQLLSWYRSDCYERRIWALTEIISKLRRTYLVDKNKILEENKRILEGGLSATEGSIAGNSITEEDKRPYKDYEISASIISRKLNIPYPKALKLKKAWDLIND